MYKYGMNYFDKKQSNHVKVKVKQVLQAQRVPGG